MEEARCGASYLEGYEATMLDFHSHDFYEITLVLSGNVSSLLADRSLTGEKTRLVLTPPGAPHFMRLAGEGLYRRINFHFTRNFLENTVPEWRELCRVFGKHGNIIVLTEDQCGFYRDALLAIDKETSFFRARLATLALLSHISELAGAVTAEQSSMPRCVVEALAYTSAHYDEKIVAASLAWRLGVGRTTLMTAFHKYMGITLTEHITRVRVRAAAELLSRGYTQEDVAVRVGFGSGSSLIRAFRHVHGVTPSAYLREAGKRTLYFDTE